MFDCAFKPAQGQRSIHYSGHIKMIGATQPFISGAISKTINVPQDATVEQIEQAYVDAWRLGAKAVSIYRDGSKRTQPLNTSRAEVPDVIAPAVQEHPGPVRRRLPDERAAITHKFDIAGHKGYITVGLFEDGAPGEMFLVIGQEGVDHIGVCRCVRDGGVLRAAVRRSAAGAGRQVQPHAVRAGRHDEEPRRARGELDRRLRLPLDGDEVPAAGDTLMAELRPCWCGCGALAVWRQEKVWGEVVWVQEFNAGCDG